MINQKNFKKLIYFFLLVYSINYIFFTYRFFLRENGYILGDWLINYSGGFVRRGLFGEINIFFSEFFKINLINTSFITVSIIFILFIYYLIKLINNSNISFLIAIIIFSPATILFNFIDPLAIARKEILFFLYLLIYFEIREKLYLKFLLLPAAIFVMFSHELFILLVPFLFISRYLTNRDINLKNFLIEIYILLFSIIYFFLLTFLSDPDMSKICSEVLKFNLDSKVCWAIDDMRKVPFSINHYISDAFYVKYYSIFFILISLPIYLVLKEYFLKNYLVPILLIIITILPFFSLFIIVNDWGRYLNIFSIYWMIILLQISKKNIAENKFKKSYLIIIFLFSSLWYMPHCCPEIHFKEKIYNPSIKYFIERISFRLQI